jgi:hypothetical protein
MRMTASWYRPLGRPNTSSWRATRARWRVPLGIVAVVDLNERGHDARVVPSDRVWRCARSRPGQVAARWPSTTLDCRSAQRPSKIRSGRGDVAGPIEQGDAPHKTLDRNRPIQVHGRKAARQEQPCGVVAIAFWGWTPQYSGRAPLKAPTYDYDAPRMNPKVATSMVQFDDPMQFWSIFASAMEENPSRRMRSTELMVVCYRDTIKSAVITADRSGQILS